jgi:hypothetical protein
LLDQFAELVVGRPTRAVQFLHHVARGQRTGLVRSFLEDVEGSPRRDPICELAAFVSVAVLVRALRGGILRTRLGKPLQSC